MEMETKERKRIKLTQEQIDAIFEASESQVDYLIGLYKIAFPDWDSIMKVDGWPKITKTTSLYIFDKAHTFDREHHPQVLPSGLWMNDGFSSLDVPDDLEDWEISTEGVEVTYK